MREKCKQTLSRCDLSHLTLVLPNMDSFGDQFANTVEDTRNGEENDMVYAAPESQCFQQQHGGEEELSGYLIPSSHHHHHHHLHEPSTALTSKQPHGGYLSQNPRHSISVTAAAQSSVDQEKLEKKRARNRLAASKCRQRKLEKITTLEEQVFRLRRENEDLKAIKLRLEKSLGAVEAQLSFHISHGCSLDIPLREQALPPFASTTSTASPKTEKLPFPPDSTCLS